MCLHISQLWLFGCNISPTCCLSFPLAIKWRSHLRSRAAQTAVFPLLVLGSACTASVLAEQAYETTPVEHIYWGPCKNGIDGPRTNNERMAWPRHVWRKLTDNQRDTLITNMQRLSASSAFSGHGGLECILYLIWHECREHIPDIEPVSTYSSCDLAKWCQKVLLNFDPSHRANHVGCDILDRLPKDVQDEVEAQLPSQNSVQSAKRFAYREALAIT